MSEQQEEPLGGDVGDEELPQDGDLPEPEPEPEPPAPLVRWALVAGAVVFSVVEQADAPQVEGMAAVALSDDSPVGPGHQWDGEYFSAPEVEPRHITQLAFQQRFTDPEAIAIDLASIGATVEAATVRRYLALVAAARYIDLDGQASRAGVAALEAAGLIGEGRADEILDGPVQAEERA